MIEIPSTRNEQKVSRKTVFLLTLLSFFFGLSGCGDQLSGLKPNTIGNAPTTAEAIKISGSVPAERFNKLVFEEENVGTRFIVPVAQNGFFASCIPAGRYRIMGQTNDGTLSLVKRGVTVEDNLTINLLDVNLVPIPTLTSAVVKQAGATDAIIEWSTDVESEGRIDFGLSPAYGQSTYTDAKSSKHHRIQLLGLLPSTTYHFRIVSTRHGLPETETYSQDYTFTTEPATSKAD